MLVTVVLVAAGAVTAGVLLRHMSRRRRAASSPPPRTSDSGEFLASIRDVFTIRGHEVWLENGWLLKERDSAVLRVFFAREGVLIATPSPHPKLEWGVSVNLTYGNEPPFTIELGGERFERASMRPVVVQAQDGCAPAPVREGILTEYHAVDASTLFTLTGDSYRTAWRTKELRNFEFERWGREE